MTEVISLMDIDDDNNKPNNNNNNSNIKGKNVVVPGESKATPWVEKYRPQSLADVAAHRDIVDTSLVTLSLSHFLGFLRVRVLKKKKKNLIFRWFPRKLFGKKK